MNSIKSKASFPGPGLKFGGRFGVLKVDDSLFKDTFYTVLWAFKF